MHDVEAAAVVLLGEGLLAALLVRLGLAARSRAPALATPLLVGAVLSALGTALRLVRYTVDAPVTLLEAIANASLTGGGWTVLAWGIFRWPGPRPVGGRTSASVLVALAVGSALLTTSSPIPNGRVIQLLVGLYTGALAAACAFLAARLRGAGAAAASWAAPLLAAQALAVVVVWRAAVQVGAPTIASLPAMRLVVALAVLASAVALAPGALALARRAPDPGPAGPAAT